MGASSGVTLATFSEWLESLTIQGQRGSLQESPRAPLSATFDAIEYLADNMIRGGTSIERQLLSKSLQETLFVTLGLKAGLSYAEVVKRVGKVSEGRGAAVILQRFLSFHFFNVTWFHTSESFRALALTSDTFETDMRILEKLCENAVARAWKTFNFQDQTIDLTAANKLIRTIEDRLRGGR
jgi:hypothetical protein